MDAQRVDLFLLTSAKYFEGHHLPFLREKMMQMNESNFVGLYSINLKDPTLLLVISILIGGLGIDRFMVGDIGLGVAKLLTCGGFGIWTIVDWFLIMGRAREVNFNAIQQAFFM